MNEPEWLPAARELRGKGRTYRRIADELGVPLTAAYRWLKPLPTRSCEGCGVEFVPLGVGRRFHSRDCWREHGRTSQAARPDVRDRISAARAKSPRRQRAAYERRRQLENAGFSLRHKGESRCRNCGSMRNLQLHHAIPRSMWRDGITEILNGVTLCVGCHLGWHNRRVVLYRDIFRPDEWACVSSAPLLGQNVKAWLDRRYPVRP